MFQFTNQFDTIEDHELTLAIIGKFPGDGIRLPFYYYDIIRKSDGVAVGKISVRIGHNYHSYYNGNVGYEINEEYQGHGLAYQACKLIFPVARFHGMEALYLTCDEDNAPSYKTIERLGAELVEVCEPPKDYFAWYEGMSRQRIYRLDLNKGEFI